MTSQDPYVTRDLGAQATGNRTDEPDRDPVEVFREPDNRIKLLLAIAVVTLLTLVLLAWVLMEVRSEHDIVEVEGQRCIVVQEEDVAALYCRR